MHTTDDLTGEDFQYRCNGETVPRRDVMPPISIDDRLGVVMDDSTSGLGAGNFVLSCVTSFYDRLREQTEEFYEYPDYYTFQAVADPVSYGEFDIWPDHKNIAVRGDPERILRAINHRGITVLLVSNEGGGSPAIDEVTLQSARRRIDSCYLYAPDGDLEDPGFSIRLPREPAAKWYRRTIDVAADQENRSAYSTSEGKYITQQFRRIDLSEAVSRLSVTDSP